MIVVFTLPVIAPDESCEPAYWMLVTDGYPPPVDAACEPVDGVACTAVEVTWAATTAARRHTMAAEVLLSPVIADDERDISNIWYDLTDSGWSESHRHAWDRYTDSMKKDR